MKDNSEHQPIDQLQKFVARNMYYFPTIPGQNKFENIAPIKPTEITDANALIRAGKISVDCIFDLFRYHIKDKIRQDELYTARRILSYYLGVSNANLKMLNELLNPIDNQEDERKIYYDPQNHLAVIKSLNIAFPELLCTTDDISFVFPSTQVPRFYEGVYEGDKNEFYSGIVISLHASPQDENLADKGSDCSQEITGTMTILLKEVGFGYNEEGSSAGYATSIIHKFHF